MSHGESIKWSLPGWRIEQRYAPGVLIGNWAEDRNSFEKDNNKLNSTYRIDYSQYGRFKPDVILRRKAQLQNNGLKKEFLFYHHGNRYSNNLISWYDEHFNQRERDEANKLPPTRSWDSNRLAWLPEKTDYPIQGSPTNFGLLPKLQKKWSDQIADETHGDFNTTYRSSYDGLPRSGMVKTRYATPRSGSTTLHRGNTVNKDLDLRGKSNLQSPEYVPNVDSPPERSQVPPLSN